MSQYKSDTNVILDFLAFKLNEEFNRLYPGEQIISEKSREPIWLFDIQQKENVAIFKKRTFWLPKRLADLCLTSRNQGNDIVINCYDPRVSDARLVEVVEAPPVQDMEKAMNYALKLNELMTTQ